jgi:imidazolonepropionase-like amidohydrolase
VRPSAVSRWQTAQAQLMKISGGVAVWRSRVERRLRLVGDMQRAGVPLLTGTDASVSFVVPGFSLHDELALLVKAGLTPLEALRTVTMNPARFSGRTAANCPDISLEIAL